MTKSAPSGFTNGTNTRVTLWRSSLILMLSIYDFVLYKFYIYWIWSRSSMVFIISLAWWVALIKIFFDPIPKFMASMGVFSTDEPILYMESSSLWSFDMLQMALFTSSEKFIELYKFMWLKLSPLSPIYNIVFVDLVYLLFWRKIFVK